jgi:hypothetical protein
MRCGRDSLLAGLIFLVASCSHFCAEVGCIAGVDVSVSKDFPVSLLPVDVTTCADDVCATSSITIAMAAPDQSTFGVGGSLILDETRERDVNVTFEMKSTTDGTVIVEASGIVRLRRSQPNGSGCEPVCYGASLTYPGTGSTLVQS